MIGIHIPGEPLAFARTRTNGKRHFTPAPQDRFMDTVGTIASRAMGGAPPLEGALFLQMRATYLWPASWSQRRKDRTLWKTSKPDLSNTLKIIEDAMNKIVWADDAQVAKVEVEKRYGPIAGTAVTITRLDDMTGVSA